MGTIPFLATKNLLVIPTLDSSYSNAVSGRGEGLTTTTPGSGSNASSQVNQSYDAAVQAILSEISTLETSKKSHLDQASNYKFYKSEVDALMSSDPLDAANWAYVGSTINPKVKFSKRSVASGVSGNDDIKHLAWQWDVKLGNGIASIQTQTSVPQITSLIASEEKKAKALEPAIKDANDRLEAARKKFTDAQAAIAANELKIAEAENYPEAQKLKAEMDKAALDASVKLQELQISSSEKKSRNNTVLFVSAGVIGLVLLGLVIKR